MKTHFLKRKKTQNIWNGSTLFTGTNFVTYMGISKVLKTKEDRPF